MRSPTMDDLCMFFAGVGSVVVVVMFYEGKVLYGAYVTTATILNVICGLLTSRTK